jgi:hypothetical protein|tara:strand:+ start:1258 stop:1611 length:354 start_codon:yes stop_codon:yes gene_type:complete
MKECNICKKRKKDSKYKHLNKKTCIKCEFRWKHSFYRLLVQDRRLSAKERLANRLGYMGTAFIMMSPHLLINSDIGGITYVVGGLLSIPQVFLAKQWNLVLVNANVMIGYTIYIFNA